MSGLIVNVTSMFASSTADVTQVVPLPAHAPLQAVTDESAAGVAVNVTCENCGNGAQQLMPQSIPAGLEITVPAPVPDLVTPSPGRGWKMAKAFASPTTRSTQLVPTYEAHEFDQPRNSD